MDSYVGRLGLRFLKKHWVAASGRRLVKPHFDYAWYLKKNRDVAASGVDPLKHYLEFGWREGRSPNSFFQPSAYLRANPDVAKSGMEPLGHYLRYGRDEKRVLQATVGDCAFVEELARGLYRTILRREPDPAGLSFHRDALMHAGGIDRVLQSFLDAMLKLREEVVVAPNALIDTRERRNCSTPLIIDFMLAAERNCALLRMRDAFSSDILDRPLVYETSRYRQMPPVLGLNSLTPGTGLFEVLAQGWHCPEDWGVWAGPRGELAIKIEPRISLPATIEIEIQAWIPENGFQNINVSVRGQTVVQVALAEIEHVAKLSLAIHDEMIKLDGVLHVAICSSNSGRLSISDERIVGFGLRSIGFAP